MACCYHLYYYGIILHLVSGLSHFYLYLRYFINYLCFILYVYFCDSIWSFTHITCIHTLFYISSYTCIYVTVIVYAIYIYVILFTAYILSYTCISVILFVYVCMYSLLNILWISDFKSKFLLLFPPNMALNCYMRFSYFNPSRLCFILVSRKRKVVITNSCLFPILAAGNVLFGGNSHFWLWCSLFGRV